MWNLAALCCAEIFGNCHVKWYAERKDLKHLIFGVLGYALMIYLLIGIFRKNSSMLYVNTIWQAAVVVLGSIVAYFILGDRLTHPVQYLGIVLALMAVLCINYKPKN